MSTPPSLSQVAIPPPFLLRMLKNVGAWGDAATPTDVRAAATVAAVFEVDKPSHSLFEVRTEDEYRRVIWALCANRDRPTKGSFCFFPITRAELDSLAIPVVHAPEDRTRCRYAGRVLHYNFSATPLELRALLQLLFSDMRASCRIETKQLESLKDVVTAEGCTAATGIASCRVPACPPAIPIPTGGSALPPAPPI